MPQPDLECVMSLVDKAKVMRDAIDGIELALQGIDHLEELQTRWQDARDDLMIKIEMDVGTFRQICSALDECNRIVHDPEYSPNKLTE